MSPSSSRPQDAFRIQPKGTFTCRVCNVVDRGGQREFYSHWLRSHYRPVERQP